MKFTKEVEERLEYVVQSEHPNPPFNINLDGPLVASALAELKRRSEVIEKLEEELDNALKVDRQFHDLQTIAAQKQRIDELERVGDGILAYFRMMGTDSPMLQKLLTSYQESRKR